MRKHARFINHQEVTLTVSGRNELRPLWMQDISKGGLFVETADPPALRAEVHVELDTPDGRLTLTAEVVHILTAEQAAASKLKPGAGLQFVRLDAKTRAAIEAYVDGLAARLSGDLGPQPPQPEDNSRLLQMMQDILQACAEESLYKALELTPAATEQEILRRVERLRKMLDTARLPAAQAARAQHVRSLVTRLGALLTDPKRRLDYDLRHGHVRAKERLHEARSEEERTQLRQQWFALHPADLPLAEKHAARALKYEGLMDYDRAIQEGGVALKHDPFNPVLNEAIAMWTRRRALMREDAEPPAEG